MRIKEGLRVKIIAGQGNHGISSGTKGTVTEIAASGKFKIQGHNHWIAVTEAIVLGYSQESLKSLVAELDKELAEYKGMLSLMEELKTDELDPRLYRVHQALSGASKADTVSQAKLVLEQLAE